jgi:hypothetical protein
MDGYSINEAATVLGIPEGRVWELLARGVLAGSSEAGDDMRVFLRGLTPSEAIPADAPTAGSADGTNGSRKANGGELSPFRELLTEFRSLTERYGQALLALGESRGEVAALRGRVELLEARMDLRLPGGVAPITAWDAAPEAAAPAGLGFPAEVPDEVGIESAAESAAEIAVEIEAPASQSAGAPPLTPRARTETRTPRRRAKAKTPRGGSRAAVSGFADALARAEDPSTAPVGTEEGALPGADEAARALAAYRDDIGLPEGEAEGEAEVDAADEGTAPAETATAPTEPVRTPIEAITAPTVPVIVADPSARPTTVPVFARPGYNTETPEPDWIAEEDLAVLSRPMLPRPVLPGPTPTATLVAEREGRGDSVTTIAVAPSESARAATAPPEIAAEPPADDDLPLLAASPGFLEPPIVPREPAFWEPEGRARAPFANSNLETWEPADLEALRAELARVAPTSNGAGAGSAEGDRPSHVSPPARRQPPRGAGARAVRRLRRLLG